MQSIKQVFDDIININAPDYGSVEEFLEVVDKHGVESSAIAELILYEDTDKIFDDHEEAFNDFLEDYCDSCNVMAPNELFFGWENRINSSGNKHEVVVLVFENYVSNLLKAIENGTSTDAVGVFDNVDILI